MTGIRRLVLVTAWLVVVAIGIDIAFFHRDLLRHQLQTSAATSFILGASVYLLFGCLRGFTLIPSTTLVIAALPFFPPWWLFLLTLAGILASSASIYAFAAALGLDARFDGRHAARIRQLKQGLERYGLPVIIGWSFFPLAPTDLVCYVCGMLRIRLRTCLLGVAIGEGTICGLYIFLGDSLLHWLRMRA